MKDRRLNNTIFIMFLATESYMKRKKITKEEFLKLNKKYDILNYISECPDVFDSMSASEMAEEIEEYVSEV